MTAPGHRHRATKRHKLPIAVLPKPGQSAVVHEPIFAQRRPGRPSLLPEDVLQRFLAAIRAGNTRADSAAYAGISETSVKHWMMRGQGRDKNRQPTPEHVRFARMVIEAEAAVKVLVVGNLVARSREDTRAALAFLQTKFPGEWPLKPGVSVGDLPGDMPSAMPLTIDQSDQRTQIVVLTGDAVPEMVAKLLAQKRAALPPPPEPEVITEEEPRGVRHADLDGLRVETEVEPD